MMASWDLLILLVSKLSSTGAIKLNSQQRIVAKTNTKNVTNEWASTSHTYSYPELSFLTSDSNSD